MKTLAFIIGENNEAESTELQQELFSRGCGWGATYQKEVSHTKYPIICLDGYLMTHTDYHYLNETAKNYQIVPLRYASNGGLKLPKTEQSERAQVDVKLKVLHKLLLDDGYASSFQSMAGYRKELIKIADNLLALDLTEQKD